MSSLPTMDPEDIDKVLDSLIASTPDAEGSNLSPTTSDEDEQSCIIIDGKEYVETRNLARPVRKNSGRKSSSIWKLGIQLKRVDECKRSPFQLKVRIQLSVCPSPKSMALLVVGLSPEVGCPCWARGRCLQLSQTLFPLGPAGALRHARQECSTRISLSQMLVVALASLRVRVELPPRKLVC